MKKLDFSNNLKKTIFLDWDVIFSICKNLNSSVFCGENFRKTIKGIFHSLGGSNKPKLLKISNFRHKIELFSWISKKFACVRFPNCTHSLSYTKIGKYPLRLSPDYFFVLRTCWGDGWPVLVGDRLLLSFVISERTLLSLTYFFVLILALSVVNFLYPYRGQNRPVKVSLSDFLFYAFLFMFYILHCI